MSLGGEGRVRHAVHGSFRRGGTSGPTPLLLADRPRARDDGSNETKHNRHESGIEEKVREVVMFLQVRHSAPGDRDEDLQAGPYEESNREEQREEREPTLPFPPDETRKDDCRQRGPGTV